MRDTCYERKSFKQFDLRQKNEPTMVSMKSTKKAEDKLRYKYTPAILPTLILFQNADIEARNASILIPELKDRCSGFMVNVKQQKGNNLSNQNEDSSNHNELKIRSLQKKGSMFITELWPSTLSRNAMKKKSLNNLVGEIDKKTRMNQKEKISNMEKYFQHKYAFESVLENTMQELKAIKSDSITAINDYAINNKDNIKRFHSPFITDTSIERFPSLTQISEQSPIRMNHYSSSPRKNFQPNKININIIKQYKSPIVPSLKNQIFETEKFAQLDTEKSKITNSHRNLFISKRSPENFSKVKKNSIDNSKASILLDLSHEVENSEFFPNDFVKDKLQATPKNKNEKSKLLICKSLNNIIKNCDILQNKEELKNLHHDDNIFELTTSKRKAERRQTKVLEQNKKKIYEEMQEIFKKRVSNPYL